MPPAPRERPDRHPAWRFATPSVLLVSGLLFGVSAHESDGTDLRGGRFTDMASVVQAESRTTTELTERAARLNAEIERLSARIGDRSVQRAQSRVEVLTDPAGLTPVTGPGLKVVLDDATPEARAAYEGDANDLVVHQQDIQAAVNALWRAGAEAVTIQGQRIISTTGIKCEGSTVTLHGVPYAPPYVIVGIGDPGDMALSVALDEDLEIYRDYTAIPTGGVFYSVEELAEATAPAYDGLLDLTWAQPIEG